MTTKTKDLSLSAEEEAALDEDYEACVAEPLSRIDRVMARVRHDVVTASPPAVETGVAAFGEVNGTVLRLMDAVRAAGARTRLYNDLADERHRDVYEALIRVAATASRLALDLCAVFPWRGEERPEGTGSWSEETGGSNARSYFPTSTASGVEAAAVEMTERCFGPWELQRETFPTLPVTAFRPSPRFAVARHQVGRGVMPPPPKVMSISPTARAALDAAVDKMVGPRPVPPADIAEEVSESSNM